MARRLGHLLVISPPGGGVSLDSLATPLRSPPGKALDALRRLHHHGLVEFREHTAVIGASSLASSIPEAQASSRIRPLASDREPGLTRVALTGVTVEL